MRITIVGTGYVGLVTGTCFAETGNDVVCLDIDEAKVEKMKNGELPIYEPGLKDLFLRNAREGRLTFTTEYEKAVAHGHVFFLCLPTPPDEDGSADVKYVVSAVREIAQLLEDGRGPSEPNGPPLLVLKSTVPLGTNARIRNEIASIYKSSFAVAANPEFLKEGAAVDDFLKPDRVVVGVSDDLSYERLRSLYEPFCRTGAPILRMDPVSAELTKYAANGFLATKISFMNEVSRICDAYGADVESVRRGISLDPRVGKHFLFPGVGYGGSCFPKDTRALVASAREQGLDMTIVDAAERVNTDQKTVLFPKIIEHFGGDAKGKTIALWGLAFKPRTDDIREAPALALIEKLLDAGAVIQAFDPEAMENVGQLLGDKITLAKGPYEALEGAEALVLVTEWNEFRTPDWRKVKSRLKRPAVFDGRNIYDPQRMRELGFEYWGIGRR